MCVYIYTYIYIYSHIYTYIYIYMCIYIHIYTYIYVYVWICAYTYIYTNIHICIMYTRIFRRYRVRWWKWKGRAVEFFTVGVPICSSRQSRSTQTRRFLSYAHVSDKLYRQVTSYEHDTSKCPVVYFHIGHPDLTRQFLSHTYESRTTQARHKRFTRHKKDAYMI